LNIIRKAPKFLQVYFLVILKLLAEGSPSFDFLFEKKKYEILRLSAEMTL